MRLLEEINMIVESDQKNEEATFHKAISCRHFGTDQILWEIYQCQKEIARLRMDMEIMKDERFASLPKKK